MTETAIDNLTRKMINPVEDGIYDKDGTLVRVEAHKHEPGNLGQIWAGPTENQLLIDRAWVRLCKHCHLAYWEQLDPVMPQMIPQNGQR